MGGNPGSLKPEALPTGKHCPYHGGAVKGFLAGILGEDMEKGDLGAGCPLGGATGSLVPGVLGGSSEPHRPGSALVALTAFKGEKPGEETEKNWAQRRDESREHRPRGAWARGGGHVGSSDGGLGQARLSQVGVPVTGGCPWVPLTVTGGCPWVPLTHRWCVPGYH